MNNVNEKQNIIEEQKKMSAFVNNYVFCNVTYEISYILNQSLENNNEAPFDYEDIQNLYYTEHDEDVINKEAEDGDMKEIFEWYLIDSYLADELEKHKEIIINTALTHYWGRQCCGQAIFLDSIIKKIMRENNILN